MPSILLDELHTCLGFLDVHVVLLDELQQIVYQLLGELLLGFRNVDQFDESAVLNGF